MGNTIVQLRRLYSSGPMAAAEFRTVCRTEKLWDCGRALASSAWTKDGHLDGGDRDALREKRGKNFQ
jgi:hypothetical protein